MSNKSTNGRISYSQYKIADILLFLVIMFVCEVINIFAIRRWFSGMMFTVSVMLLVSLVVLIRWNLLGAIFPVAGGLVYCWMMGAEGWQFAEYAIGNAFIVIVWFLFFAIPKEKVVGHWWLTAAYALVAFILMVLGRATVAACFGKGFATPFIQNLTTESLNFAFALSGLMILRKIEGMLADQKKYLIKVTTERDTIKHAEEFHWDGYTELNEEDLQALAAMDEYDRAVKFNKRSLKELKENDGYDETEDE